jgi:hypothetical protein
VLIAGDKPPWTQKMRLSMSADKLRASQKQLNKPDKSKDGQKEAECIRQTPPYCEYHRGARAAGNGKCIPCIVQGMHICRQT